MDVDLIERLIGLVEHSRVTELIYVEGSTRVRLARADPVPQDAGGRVPAPVASSGTPPTGLHVITAGMPGTFFRSPAPDQAPFVAEGDRVEEGQVLALVEAMKMLNPVEADRAGRITRILVANAAPVAVGTTLFELAEPD